MTKIFGKMNVLTGKFIMFIVGLACGIVSGGILYFLLPFLTNISQQGREVVFFGFSCLGGIVGGMAATYIKRY